MAAEQEQIAVSTEDLQVLSKAGIHKTDLSELIHAAAAGMRARGDAELTARPGRPGSVCPKSPFCDPVAPVAYRRSQQPPRSAAKRWRLWSSSLSSGRSWSSHWMASRRLDVLA